MEQQTERLHTFRDMPAAGVSEDRAAQVIEDIRTITGICGAMGFTGIQYEDQYVHISRTDRQVYITLKRPDESGDDETEVFDAYNDGAYSKLWTLSTLRPGAWMDYVCRLAQAVMAYDESLNDRAAQMVERSFEPVKDDELNTATAAITPQKTDDTQRLMREIWDLREHIDRRLSKLQSK